MAMIETVQDIKYLQIKHKQGSITDIAIYEDGLIEISASNGTEKKDIIIESIGTPELQVNLGQIEIKI